LPKAEFLAYLDIHDSTCRIAISVVKDTFDQNVKYNGKSLTLRWAKYLKKYRDGWI
jgi:hypothetical protein